MRKSAKKLLSGVLAGLMVVSMAPISALAADYEPGDVVDAADYLDTSAVSPEIDVVWTAYTGLNKNFITNGDEEWQTSADNDTVADLSKVSLEGKTANSTDFPSGAIKSGKYYVTATFILKNYGGQFGNCQLSFSWDDSLTMGKRTAKGFTDGDGRVLPTESEVSDADGNPYLIDGGSKYRNTSYYLSIAHKKLSTKGTVVYTGDTYTFETSGPLGGDDDLGVVLDGLYLGTFGFQVSEGTVISDDLLTFNQNPGLSTYYMGSNDTTRMFTFTGKTDASGTADAAGTLKIAKDATPETKSYTVNYVTEDGTSLGSEVVEEGKSPASVPELPTKAADAAGHYSYAWDTDPSTATISADTTFTAKLTTTAHTAATMDSNIKDATCGTPGSKTVTTYCSVCDYVISVEDNVVIPATGNHTAAAAVKENVKPATCETAETYDSVVYCSVCGDELSRTSMTGDPATGHKWGEWKHDDSTAKAESKHTRTCQNDASHTETVACTFTSQVTQQQTADLPEITTYTCSDCGYSYTEETKPALGHTHNYGAPVADYTSGEAYVEGKAYTHTSTCTGEGTCSQPTKTEACTFDNGVVTQAATCTKDGVKTFTCSECGGTYTVAIPATGHNYGAWSHVDGTEGEAAQHQRVCANDASHVETAACSFTAKIVQEATVDQPELTQYTCAVCGYAYTAQTKPPHTHDYQPTQVVTPTCTAGGYTVYSCTVCGDEVHRDETQALGHDYTAQVIAQPTCTAYGKTKYTCTRCGDSYTVSNIKPKGHSYKSQLTKATTGKDGQSYKKCTVCGAITGKTVIPKASNIYLSKTAFTYNGKVQRPTVTVKDSKGKTLKNGTDYSVSIPNGKSVGRYTVKVTLKGNYSGSKSMTYNINPKGTSVSKVTAAKKGFKVTWKKQATQTTGYQVQYSTSSKFKSAKTVTISKNKTTSKSVSKLTAKKKYYVRVRTYKTVKVNGKNVKLYSGWSKAKSVTTKK